MNAATASVGTAAEPLHPIGSDLPVIGELPERRLHVVERSARRRKPRMLYGIVAVAGALAIAVAQMTLSVLTTQTTYELASLQSQQQDLTYQKQILSDEVAGLSSPQYLAANASALGMVTGESPSYLRLSDGAVLGPREAAGGASSIDALSRAAVANALITDTPLVTAPEATIDGPPAPTVVDDTGESTTPPALTDGLPTPATH